MGLFSGIASLFQAGKQRRLARKIHPVNTTYEENPYIKSLYGEGRNLYQGRMAGAGSAEQNILTNQANAFSNVENNATDASQALAVGAGISGQTNAALSDLATSESQDKQRRFGVYSDVSQLMAQEGNKVYNDKLRRYYDDLNYKRGLEGAAMQNSMNLWQGLDDTAELAVSAFSPGGLAGNGRRGRASYNGGGGGTNPGSVPRTPGYYQTHPFEY